MMLMDHPTDQIEARRTDIPGPPSFAHAAEDYDCVRRALAYLSENWREQPDVAAVARAVGLSADGLTILFRRWVGLGVIADNILNIGIHRRCLMAQLHA